MCQLIKERTPSNLLECRHIHKQLKELTDEVRKKDESERSWEDKYYLWHEKVMTSPLDSPYDVGEEREFYDGKSLANNEIKDGFGNDFPEWFRKAGLHFGEKCKMVDKEVYTLVGMSETFEDYIVKDENGRTFKHSCVGGITFI